MADVPTSSNSTGSTGTAPTGTGPGSGPALQAALTNYLAAELAAAQQNGSAGNVPVPQMPQQQAPVIIQQPASQGVPGWVALLALVIGLASGAAYLIDRRKGGKK